MDNISFAMAIIPVGISIVSIVFGTGIFYGKTQKLNAELEKVNGKLDKLTIDLTNLRVEFAEYRGASNSGVEKPTLRAHSKGAS